jgi:hypothetical protein
VWRRGCRGFALNRGENRLIGCVHRVVAGEQGRPHGLRALPGEAERVALPAVGGDRDRIGERSSAGDPAAGVDGAGRLLGLPEDRLAAFTYVKTNWERASRGRSSS